MGKAIAAHEDGAREAGPGAGRGASPERETPTSIISIRSPAMRSQSCYGFLLALVASAAGAQQVAPLAPGAHVRVTRAYRDTAVHAASLTVEGRLVSLDRDSVTLRVKGEKLPLSLPLSAVDHLDVDAGRNRGKGAAVGAVIGGALGAGFALTIDNCSEGCIMSTSEFVIGLSVAAAGVGTVVGILVGTQAWHRVDPPATVTITPLRTGGVGVGLSMRF